MPILREWYAAGGAFPVALLVIAVAGLAIILERLYVVVIRSRADGRTFIERVITLVRGGRVDDAIKLCVQSKTALSDMGLLILRSRSRDEDDLHNVADAAALSVMPRLTRRLRYLPMLATVAVLVGLLGTVLGLAAAFRTGRPPALQLWMAGEALAATAMGLVVAIPLIVLHTYLASQAESIAEQIEEFSVRLVNALVDKPDVRLGHR